MIHEIVIQHVQPERRDEYIKAFGEFLKTARYPGSHGIRFFASIEDSGRVILMIDWDTVEAHTQIRGTPTYNAMRELTGKYQTAKSDGGHFIVHEVNP
jgi:heme-degrading monooxygenase HmoA